MLGRKNTGMLALAGLAAWAYYKYNKMSADEKQQLTGKIKEHGKKLMEMVPENLKNKIPSV